jgi:hypothetical protein
MQRYPQVPEILAGAFAGHTSPRLSASVGGFPYNTPLLFTLYIMVPSLPAGI